MKFSNKRGVELAANTVVLLIIAIAILGMGTAFTYSVFCTAEDLAQNIDDQTSQQIDRMLTSGGALVVAEREKSAQRQGSLLCGGSPEEVAVYTVGIRNTGVGSAQMYLDIPEVLDPNANPVADMSQWRFESFISSPQQFAESERQSSNLLVAAPDNSPIGEYTITLHAVANGHILAVQKVYFTIE